MKSILISIRPEWTAKILNGEKTIEIRKTAPKQPYCEVYIYCTKSGEPALHPKLHDAIKKASEYYRKGIERDSQLRMVVSNTCLLNGKVVAKFTLRSVEKITYHFGHYDTWDWSEKDILDKSCLTAEQLDDYLQASKTHDTTKPSPVYGYAWHISDLQIFDEPKTLSEFGLKRAPQSYCYVETKE